MSNTKIKCIICGDSSKEFKNNNSYIGSHVKRVHGIGIKEYVEKYYTNISKNFKEESCGFCDRPAAGYYEIDHINKTYSKSYINDRGKLHYFCDTIECKEKISLDILGIPYNKKKFEHIGSVSEYISKVGKRDINEVLKTKSKGAKSPKYNLQGYIDWYGKEEGTKKYKDARKRSSMWFTKEEHIEKYGEKSWIDFRKSIRIKSGDKKISKGNLRVKDILEKNNTIYDMEYPVKYNDKFFSVDFYLEEMNVVIEYYGVYWHASPKLYEKNYYNKVMKKYSHEIWEKDANRIEHVMGYFNNDVTIFIIWEDCKKTDDEIFKTINDNKNTKSVIEIR